MSLDAFLNDPRLFLTANIVLPPASGSPVLSRDDPGGHRQSGVFEFAFAQSAARGKLPSGKDCSVFRIEKADSYNAQLPRFRAYFCFYQPDELHMLVVDRAAEIMLTPKMDGCSFGVGSATPSGARMVAHANVSRESGTPQGIAKQESDQAQLLNAAFQNPTLMQPSRYVAEEGVAGTTVGKRTGGQWSFFTQSWRRVSSDYFLVDVLDF